MRATIGAISLGFVVCALCACGGGMAPQTTVPPPGPPPPPVGEGDKTTTGTGGMGGVPDGAMDKDVPHAQITFDESVKAFEAANGACASMCKALSSMERAAEHLCELTKGGAADDKKRCDDAQARVVNARERIKSSCGACE